MRRTRLSFSFISACVFVQFISTTALAQTPAGTAFLYQGRLKDNGSIATGIYDFRFRLYDADTAGTQIGTNQFAADLSVTDGLFTATVDFGAGAFTKDARWLEIAVRPGTSGGAYTILTPRQRIQPAPLAIQSLNDANWAQSGADILSLNTGDVGIGVNNPSAKFHVKNTGTQQNVIPPSLRAASEYPTASGDSTEYIQFEGNRVLAVKDNADSTLRLQPDGGQVMIGTLNTLIDSPVLTVSRGAGLIGNSNLYLEDLLIHDTANAWLGLYSDSVGNVASGITLAEYGATQYKWAMYARTTSNVGDLVFTFGSDVNPTANEVMMQIDRDGTTKVKVLEILGADVAEKFPMTEDVAPGMVVEIDATHPGQLCLSRGAYNRRVAGIVSGAGDIPAGAILGNMPCAGNGHPIALTGRVWVNAHAAERAIEPGDLLTTAERPGYAMAVADPTKGIGATIGKAMTGLEKGRSGLVLVLVNLQ